jgi:hypothetical protein
VRCISSSGILLQVSKKDFIHKFGKFDATWKGIVERIEAKDLDTMSKLVKRKA